MILYYKTKILISGLFPMVNFKIDGFIEKTELYDENMIDINNPDYIFYSSGHLLNSMYACNEKEGNYYEYFENEEMIKYEVDDEKRFYQRKLTKQGNYSLQKIAVSSGVKNIIEIKVLITRL